MKTVVIIPNYNGKHFLEKCMQALERQSTKDFSILFVDNASSDGSIPIIKEYIEKEPERIFLLENKSPVPLFPHGRVPPKGISHTYIHPQRLSLSYPREKPSEAIASWAFHCGVQVELPEHYKVKDFLSARRNVYKALPYSHYKPRALSAVFRDSA